VRRADDWTGLLSRRTSHRIEVSFFTTSKKGVETALFRIYLTSAKIAHNGLEDVAQCGIYILSCKEASGQIFDLGSPDCRTTP
jgi:hypothetical protein